MNVNDLDAFLKAESVEDIKAISDKSMNTQQHDGGPAFPIPCNLETCTHEACCGMSLRDWFAGQTMTSLIAGGSRMVDPIDGEQLFKSPENVARSSYLYADAMLKERDRINTTSPGDDPV